MSKVTQFEEVCHTQSAVHSPILDCDCLDCEKFFANGSSPKTSSLKAAQLSAAGLSGSAVPPCLALNATGTSLTCYCAMCREMVPNLSRWTAVAMHSSCCCASASLIARKRRAVYLASNRTPHYAVGSDSSSDTPRVTPSPTRQASTRSSHLNILKLVPRRSRR